MKYDLSNIAVNGIPFLETDMDKFKTSDEMHEWFWNAMDQLESLNIPEEVTEEELFGKEFEDKRLAKWNSLVEADEINRKLQPIEIGDDVYKPFLAFDIAHVGWECDSVGWIAKDSNDKNVIIFTNHGSPYLGTTKELANIIERYEKLITSTIDAHLKYLQ